MQILQPGTWHSCSRAAGAAGRHTSPWPWCCDTGDQWSLGTRTSPWLGQPWSSLHRRVSMGNEKQHSNDSQTERPPNFQSNVCVDKCWDVSDATHVKLMLKSNVLTERITWETHDKTRLKVCRRKSFQFELLRSLQCQNWFSIFMVVLIAWKCVLQSCKN